jgi:hypothetical protein
VGGIGLEACVLAEVARLRDDKTAGFWRIPLVPLGHYRPLSIRDARSRFQV